MDKEQAKQELKSMLRQYLEQVKGVNTSKKAFKCISPTHDDRHASMGIVGSNCHCFACGATYDVIDLLAMDNGLDSSRDFFKVLEIGCRMFNIPYEQAEKPAERQSWNGRKPSPKLESPSPAPKDNTDYYKGCAAKLEAGTYLQGRGISIDTGKRFWLGYDSEFKTFDKGKGSYAVWDALIIPTGKYSFVARNTDAGAGADDRYRKQGQVQVFNLKAVDAGRAVFVVEGELDALSIEDAGFKAIGLGSVSNIDKLVKHFESVRPSNLLLLAMDKDEAGQKAQAELREKLAQLQLKAVDVDIAGAYKDANERLIADRQGLIDACQQAEHIEDAFKEAEQEAYRQSFAGNRLDKFLSNVLDNGQYNPVGTGFKSIDDLLEGGLYAGLYVIGAISSLGKTTFCLQVASQIAKNNVDELERWQAECNSKSVFDNTPMPAKPSVNDVLIFSLEMSEDEVIAKALSRETLKISETVAGAGNISLAKTTRGILTGKRWDKYSDDELNTLYGAMDAYKRYAQYIKIIEGMGDVGTERIREAVERHIAITGNRPIVIVDYLQILAPSNERGTDKQNTDKAVLELKKISRDFRTPVIAISSFNRESYLEPVSMSSFKESGAVEYSSDVLLGLQYAGMDYAEGETPKDKNRIARVKGLAAANIELARAGKSQELQLKVLKNRNGTKGGAYIDFCPMFNSFEERPIFTGGERLGEAVAGAGWEALGTVEDATE